MNDTVESLVAYCRRGNRGPDLLPPPDEVAAEIVENLETALDRLKRVAAKLQTRVD